MRNCTKCNKDLTNLKSAHSKCWHCRTGNKPKRKPKILYSAEAISQAVSKSNNVMDVMRLLGIKIAGGSHSHLTRKIKEYGIDTSHFLGKGSTKGKPANNKKHWSELLILRPEGSRRESNVRMRRAMLEYGFTYECSACKLDATWQGKSLTLHIDHVSGIMWDNRPENVRFLCPNCHSQTETYCRPK
jgi:DNA-directed RNA polymerase subunit M/transcription elongation factor TFIIS